TLEPSASICSLVDELINTVANSLDERKTELVDAEADGSGVATSSHSGESKSAEIDETSPRSREQTPSGSFSRVTSVVAHLATALAEEAVAQVSDLPKFVGR
uniref:Uncharacterized protein n=1 Tax=Plectus sambesii TaxID=2011161 RepID=A0A914WU45_9BILA